MIRLSLKLLGKFGLLERLLATFTAAVGIMINLSGFWPLLFIEQLLAKTIARKFFGCLANLFETDSVQSSRNTRKNYLLKMYPQHGNFLNAI